MADAPTPPADKSDEGKTFTQADIDRIVADRLAREKSKYADYDELKAKAAKLDEQEAASKSEADQLRDQLAKAQSDLEKTNAEKLRIEIAAEKGIKPRWLNGSTREELEAAAEEYLADHPAGSKPEPVPGKPAVDLKGGGDPTEDPPVDVKSVVESIPRGF